MSDPLHGNRDTARPFTPASLDHVVLRALDIDAMLHFYRDVLGCAVARHNPAIGLWHLRLGTTMIDLVDMTGPLGRAGGAAPTAQGHNVDHVCIRVAPFDPELVRAYLADQGVPTQPAVSRYGAQGEGLSIYLKDPQGNGVELRGALVQTAP